jgi:predicted transcriptional regulator
MSIALPIGMFPRVADIMERDVVTLSPDMDLRDASLLLSERQISGAPVCARDGRLLGVFSAADVVEHCASSAAATRVGQIMTPAVLTIGANEAVQRAVETMAFEGVHRLIVVDDGRLVGIVTSMDVLRELAGYPRREGRVVAVGPPEDTA